jgi:predicted ATPase
LLKSITLLRERVSNWDVYPFSVPAIRNLHLLELSTRIVFFVGENGTGKSTLLEAIAAHYGFGREGGNRNFRNDSTESNSSIDPLMRALRLSFDKRTGKGFFLRAESFFNSATYVDEIGAVQSYGGRSLHAQSHGESFFTLLDVRFRQNGLFLLDEPEAALSPQRQLAFLVLMNDTLRKYKDAQFIISTHSPILAGFPGAEILSFDSDHIHPVGYEQIPSVQISKRFLGDRRNFLTQLLQEELSLFPESKKVTASKVRKRPQSATGK